MQCAWCVHGDASGKLLPASTFVACCSMIKSLLLHVRSHSISEVKHQNKEKVDLSKHENKDGSLFRDSSPYEKVFSLWLTKGQNSGPPCSEPEA